MRGRQRRAAAVACAAIGIIGLVTPAAHAGEDWSITPATSRAANRTIDEGPQGWRLSTERSGHLSDRRTGTLTFPARQLDAPVNRVKADIDAAIPAGSEAAIDIRGKRADGTWTEWTEARPDAVLPSKTRTVQARLVLIAPEDAAGPRVSRIVLEATHDPNAAATPAAPEGPAEGYRVFATREGLVGGTTANGHVIVERDHFVALPSRRGLADNNSGNYTVQVCTEDGARCEWAPVWDVGPWNTKDDYWNAEREMWQDLPQGKPEAQAAYEDGYNGGKDEFGRQVGNPAGIDLADGTFWDGLQLSDNSWVVATYEWTATGPWGTIATEGPTLNVRAEPASTAPQVGLAAKYAQVRIECAVTGEVVNGNDQWFRLAAGKFVAAAYVQVGEAPGPC